MLSTAEGRMTKADTFCLTCSPSPCRPLLKMASLIKRPADDRGVPRGARDPGPERNLMNVQVFARPIALALVLGLPAGGVAQPEDPAPPAEAPPHVIRLEGAGAQVVREGTATTLELGDPVFYGDRLDAGQAFGQVLWGDGTRVALDRGARFEALAPDLLAVTAGRVLVARPVAVTTPIRVDTPAASLVLAPGGEYRVALDADVTTLSVVRGRADVQTGMGGQVVEAGHQITMRDGVAPDAPRRFNAAGYDSFVEWANRPAAAPAAGAPLETFQDPQFEAYSDVFNSYGSWETDAQDGTVWYPQVAADWRPYADGYWQPYGAQSQWLWVGRDPWGWPTHHYGRWGVNPRGRWYWMPGRQWAPSYVSWSVGPGYIGWTPLGSQDRPQWGWDSVAHRGAYAGGTLDPWRAWTVIPSDHFGQRGRLGAYAVDPRTLDNLSAFVSQRVGPPVRYGTPRGSGYGYGSGGAAPYGGPGGTTMYGPGGYYGGVSPRPGGGTTGVPRGGIGPTRVGPLAPGYGGPTPPADDPYERAQRAVVPRSRQRTPATAETPADPAAPAPSRQRSPSRAGPADAPPSAAPESAQTPPAAARDAAPPPPPAARRSPPPAAPAARETPPPPPPAAEPRPPVPESTPPPASSGRATGATNGRRAVPRPD
jgi:hypothetical protein